MPSIALTNARQREFNQELRRHRLPSEFHALFNNLNVALDFLQAYFAFRSEELTRRPGHPKNAWGRKVLMDLHEKTLNLYPKRVNELCALGHVRIETEEISSHALTLPFTSPAGEYDLAQRLWDLILKALYQEDLKVSMPLAINLIPMLLLQPRAGTWPNLARGVKLDIGHSRKLFGRLVRFLAFFGVRPRFYGYSHPHFAWMERENYPLSRMVDELARNIPFGDEDYHRLPAPDDCAYACNNTVKELTREQAWVGEYVRLISWFGAYEEDFQKRALEMWDAITKDSTHGLRPGGRDVIAVKVPALYKTGLRHIQLIPATQFPHALVRYWVVLDDLDFRYFLDRKLNSPILREATGEVEEGLESAADRLRQFISLHCLWKITSGQLFKKIKHKKTEGGEKKREQLERAYLVRPHFRWLIPGWKASDRALTRSLESFHQLPPEGKTFVRSDLTPAEIVAGIQPLDPEHPLYTYTSEDLGCTED